MIAATWASLVMKHGGGTRIGFYEGFQNLVENGLSVNDALKELHKVWSDDGKSLDAPLAIVTRDLLVQLSNGTPLSRALSRWVPYEEASLIAAGEQAARLVEACDDVVRVIIAKQQIIGAVATAVVYPAFLCIPLSFLLWIVSVKMVPAMARISPPDSWSGASYVLYQLASFITDFGIGMIFLLVALAAVFVMSLPRWTGSVRMVFDRGPFYSTYRMIHGSTFLLNLAVMMRANIPLYQALEMLGEYSNAWLRERISGALYGIRMGSNLGVALENAGHNFPDKKAIQFIRILAAREGFSHSINRYAERWLTASIKRIQFIARLSLTTMIILIGCVMGLVVLGTQDMQNNLEQSANRASSAVRP